MPVHYCLIVLKDFFLAKQATHYILLKFLFNDPQLAT